MIKADKKILALVSDLFFISRIEAAAAKAESEIRWLESASQCDNFPAYLLDFYPNLVLVDLNFEQIPWKTWITEAKQNPQTQDIPVVMFGSHKDVELMKTAKQTGADKVVAKSRFVEILTDLLDEYTPSSEN